MNSPSIWVMSMVLIDSSSRITRLGTAQIPDQLLQEQPKLLRQQQSCLNTGRPA